MVPSVDGLSLEPYNGADSGQMTVNGELHKLAHNISFGHGIHAGIHWRSDTDYSILLGEAVALSFPAGPGIYLSGEFCGDADEAGWNVGYDQELLSDANLVGQ